MNTYGLHKPNICFRCCMIFDRIDNHLSQKHFQRGSEEFADTLKVYKEQTFRLLSSTNTFDNNKIHNVLKLLQKKQNDFDNNETSHKTQSQELTDELPESSHISANETQSQELTDQLPESSHTSAIKTKTAVDDPVPGPSKTKRVAVDKSPSKTKIVVDNEVPGPSGYRNKQRGQFISQKHSKKVNLLKNKHEINVQFTNQYRLFNRLEFRYYYKDAKKNGRRFQDLQ